MKTEHLRLIKAAILTGIVATACLFFGVLFAREMGWSGFHLAEWTGRTQERPLLLPASLPLTVDERGSSPFVAVAERLMPSVVYIKVSTPINRDGERFFGDFFRMPDDRFHQNMPEMNSSGSGFIIDEDGYILTNNHVVENASDITVTLSDKSEVDGKIVGTDPITDVAVVKIDAKHCKGRTAPLGNSDDIRVGDWAIAIGSPLGLTQSLTVGVISAKGRVGLPIAGQDSRNGALPFQNYIQTDAAINFGNSGGPLVNINGQVMAINTAINANAQSIGFAIPINIARKVYQDLRDHGSVVHGYLGMVPRQLTAEMRQALGLDEGVHGIFVDSVQDGTPADEGKLQQGDVIVEWDGKPATDEADFRTQVAEGEPGQKVRARILRDGEQKTLDFVLGDRSKAARSEGAAPDVQPGSPEKGSLDIQVSDIDDYQIRRFRLDPEQAGPSSGVVVVAVGADSPAHGRLQAGDVITRIGRSPIRGVKDFVNAERELTKNRPVLVYLIRGGQRTTETIPLGE